MMTDYKFNFINQDGGRVSGRITIYEGDMAMRPNVDGILVSTYVRSKVLKTFNFDIPTNLSLNQLRLAMNLELKKDPTRVPISDQST